MACSFESEIRKSEKKDELLIDITYFGECNIFIMIIDKFIAARE
jgi:hypothetical protein